MTPSRRVALAAAAVLVLVVAVVVALTVTHRSSSGPTPLPLPTTAPPTAAGAVTVPVVPRSGLYLGAWVAPTVKSQVGRVQAFDSLQSQLGQPLAIAHTYRAFTDPIGTASDRALAAGHYLLISWSGDDTRRIISGADDPIIAAHARQIAALDRPVFLRFRWEMDRADLASQIHSPADFVAAWRHVRAVFAQQHVHNVSWVWCPTAHGFDSGRAQQYYPGDDEVDWVCADGYAFADADGVPRTFASVMSSFFKWAARRPKPIMIAEFGVDTEFGAQRGPWIAAVAQTLAKQPNLKALVYFDNGVGGAWSLDGDTGAFDGLRRLAQTGSARAAPS